MIFELDNPLSEIGYHEKMVAFFSCAFQIISPLTDYPEHDIIVDEKGGDRNVKQKRNPRNKKQYCIGTRIKLIKMDDMQAPPTGTIGTVVGVDDQGALLVDWDTGSGLSIIVNEDEFEIL